MTKHIAIGLVILSVLLLSVSIKLIRSSHVGQGCYDAGVAHERASADWQQQNADGIVVNAYMGDDVNDFESVKEISKQGIAVAPANATRKIMALANIVTKKTGGHGAVREFAEMVIDARGKDESVFPPA